MFTSTLNYHDMLLLCLLITCDFELYHLLLGDVT